MLSEALSLVAVAALWGGTNPLIKRNSKDIVHIKSDSILVQFLMEVRYLITNVNYLIPMALNQLGSVLYFLALQSADLTLAVPVANSLTFVFTAISGCILGEKFPGRSTVLGAISVSIGTALCLYDKNINSGISG